MLDKTLFKSFNNKNTTTEKQRQRTQIPKGRRKLEIIYQWDIVCYILKQKTIKNNIQIKEGDKKEIEMVTYCIACWLHWTPPNSKYHY